MIKLDFVQFIRRFTIIILEDAILHPDIPFLMFLTGASAEKDFVLSEEQLNKCLDIVYETAAIQVRDPIPLQGKNPFPLPTIQEIERLPPLESALIKAINSRISYGGMAGDMEMLSRYCGVWYTRFSSLSAAPNGNKTWIDYLTTLFKTVRQGSNYKFIAPLNQEDCILSGCLLASQEFLNFSCCFPNRD